MQRVAGAADAWATLYPMTSSTNVATAGIRQENIGASTDILGMSFYLPTNLGQRLKADLVIYDYQEVDVFWVLLFGCHGTQQRNSSDSAESGYSRHEPEDL